ncbi:hypothetical protein [Salinigranum sp. GCM10025319]|uniref:hypothetical protein n=1 Tax=Salinigranum sp. GCM10025319 TaxID=3252687 RepID=UPI00361526ED
MSGSETEVVDSLSSIKRICINGSTAEVTMDTDLFGTIDTTIDLNKLIDALIAVQKPHPNFEITEIYVSEPISVDFSEENTRSFFEFLRDSNDGLQITLEKADRDSPEANDKAVNREAPPPVPMFDQDFPTSTHKGYYQRLVEKEDSQPAIIRRLIYQKQSLKKSELGRLLSARGYKPDSGGVDASLRVLEDVTQEISREGRGSDQQITWVGTQE